MSQIAIDIRTEHQRAADVLSQVGPDAPSGISQWSAGDMAAHLYSQSTANGLPVFLGRSLIARGVNLTNVGTRSNAKALARFRRKGFEEAVSWLRNAPPKILTHPRVAPVSLFEIWVHTDDLVQANGLTASPDPVSLPEVLAVALRYQRKHLAGKAPNANASTGDQLRWLAGRPSSIPPHDPPLRF